MFKEFAASDHDTTDAELRAIVKKQWATLTEEEKVVITKYTQTFSYLNERLRGLTYYGGRSIDEYNNDLPLLTSALQKLKLHRNMCVRRGTGDYPLAELGKSSLGELKAGDQFTDGAFLSTACHPSYGFHQTYNLVIAVPKGAAGIYAEPLTHYNDYLRFDWETKNLWDGISDESFGSEMEWIGQRGARFEVIKKVGKTIYLKMIAQLK